MKRRDFIKYSTLTPLAAAFASGAFTMPAQSTRPNPPRADVVTLFIAGDVMTGRGIDQILPHPGSPRIFEPYSRSAWDYVRLAEQANGPIPRPVDFAYIWGDALALLDAAAPDLRIINLETAVTRRGEPWPRKGIQYRMHPDNIPCLSAAAIDCCVLANNHVLDWGYAGFEETLSSLSRSGLTTVGAGLQRAAAQTPTVFDLPGPGRVLVFAWGLPRSGIPATWAATTRKAGVNLLPDVGENAIRDVPDVVARPRQAGDVVVASLHWGGNWGYPIPDAHRQFAHALIDTAAVDLVHGHSSHHPLGIEVYRGKPVIYGCGDLIDDYEGISGHEEYRIDLALLYLVTLERGSGNLRQLEMIPMQRRKFRLNRTMRRDSDWLREVLDRESRPFGARVERTQDNTLQLRWG